VRLMGLDYGSKTVGVAITDELMITVQNIETIERNEENKLRRTCARIEELIREYGVTEIVLGLPLNMDDSMSERGRRSLEFKEMLERRTGLPVHMQDERLTTVAAEEILRESGVKPKNRKAYIDKIAAGIILQDYLNGRDVL